MSTSQRWSLELEGRQAELHFYFKITMKTDMFFFLDNGIKGWINAARQAINTHGAKHLAQLFFLTFFLLSRIVPPLARYHS